MAEINQNYEKMPGFGRGGGGGGHGGGAARFQPHQKPKNSRGTIRRLLAMLLQWRGRMLAAVFLTLISSSIAITLPLLIGRAINTFDIRAGTVDTGRLYTILLAIGACYLTAWAIDTTNGVIMAHVTQKLV
jgi:ATP-binding cassette subfamily B protein